jgi:hypothetical protein
MSHTLIWNLGNANPDVEHGEYVYDLLYLSISKFKNVSLIFLHFYIDRIQLFWTSEYK